MEGGYLLSSAPTVVCCLTADSKTHSHRIKTTSGRVSRNEASWFLTDFIFLNGMCAHSCPNMCVWKPELTLAAFLYCFLLCFFGESVHWIWSSLAKLDWLAVGHGFWLLLPSPELGNGTDACCHAQLCLSTEELNSRLHSWVAHTLSRCLSSIHASWKVYCIGYFSLWAKASWHYGRVFI